MFTVNQQAVFGLHRLTDPPLAQVLLERLPTSWRVANAVGVDNFTGEATLVQILLGALPLLHFQPFTIEARGQLKQVDALLALFLALLGAGVNKDTIMAWTQDPSVPFEGKKTSLFDLLEDMDSKACIEKAVAIASEK